MYIHSIKKKTTNDPTAISQMSFFFLNILH